MNFTQSKPQAAVQSSQMDGFKMYSEVKTVYSVDAYIDEKITDLSYYRDLLQFLRTMEPEDEIRIWISSPGGYLETAKAIIEAIVNSKGKVTCITCGDVSSAATILALSAPNLFVMENTTFMLHNAFSGVSGKYGDMEAYVDFNRKDVRKILEKSYENFLTPEEMQMLFVGKDYYFDYDEVVKRLEKRQKLQEQSSNQVALPKPRKVKPIVKPSVTS